MERNVLSGCLCVAITWRSMVTQVRLSLIRWHLEVCLLEWDCPWQTEFSKQGAYWSKSFFTDWMVLVVTCFHCYKKKSVFSKFTGISLFLVLLLVFIQSKPKGRLSVGKIFTMVIVFLQGKILLMRIWCLVYVSVCVILLWLFFKSLSESFGRTVSAQKLHVRHQCRYWRNEIRKYPVPKHLEHISEQWPPIPRPDHENQAQRFSESVSDTQAASSFTSDMNYFNWLVVFRYDR